MCCLCKVHCAGIEAAGDHHNVHSGTLPGSVTLLHASAAIRPIMQMMEVVVGDILLLAVSRASCWQARYWPGCSEPPCRPPNVGEGSVE